MKTETVRYGDIRLISAVGAAVLYGRLQSAAERACGGPLETVPLAQRQRFKVCVDDAVAKAVSDVNNPMLTWYQDSKRGKATAKTRRPAALSPRRAKPTNALTSCIACALRRR